MDESLTGDSPNHNRRCRVPVSFDWSEYLVLAKELAACEAEAQRRSSISRAYYSAFCSARDWLVKHDSNFRIPNDGESHAAVWKYFEQAPDRRKVQVGREGFKLKRSRQDADYNSKYGEWRNVESIKAELIRAERVLNLLRQL